LRNEARRSKDLQGFENPGGLKTTEKMKITGTHIAYYLICARKLWFFCKGIRCEHESDAVRLGKHIHETSYKRKKKEISIDGVIVVDWIDHDKKIIHEVKKSDKMEHSHEWQLKYYMWYLEQKGLDVAEIEDLQGFENLGGLGYTGELNYPRLNKKKKVILTKKDRKIIEHEIIPGIKKIAELEKPPKTIEWEVCKNCSYNELCYG
jgi:CRISPR-associated exonuclease Cas4